MTSVSPRPRVSLADFIADIASSPLAPWAGQTPWSLTTQSDTIVRRLGADLAADDYIVTDEQWLHRSAIVEPGAVLKGPLVLGPGCFVAAGAYLRGGNWIGEHCVIGPGSEVKSSFLLPGTALAHFNFVGDSVVGRDVNLETGSIVCNHRNERQDKDIRVRIGDSLQHTGVQKFGALIGDGARIGANAVIAPGALLRPGTVVARTALYDGEMDVS